MPSEEDLKNRVRDSRINEWEFFDAPQTITLTPDREICLKRIGDGQSLNQDWADEFPHSDRAKRVDYRALYRGTPFYQVPFASLDEGRIIMALPHKGMKTPDEGDTGYPELYIHEFDREVGRILTAHAGFGSESGKIRHDNAVERAGFEVVED